MTQSPGSTSPAPLLAELAPHFPQLELLELVGQGGMGIVYKARQPRLDRLVALKILAPEMGDQPAFAERFAREARSLARLNHPNIVGIYDFGQAGGFYYFIMEYVDGANLRQMERAQRLTPEQALSIVPKLCEALQYAHDEGIVHRDIKPGNILIDKKGRVKIADFGLAKLAGKAPTDAMLTQSHHVMGTPVYMAPEQIERPLTVDHRADIYSLGVVFYEMLTDELPIGRFALPSQRVQIDVRLDDVVLKSLEKEPGRRYQHASEVKTDLASIESTPPSVRAATSAAPSVAGTGKSTQESPLPASPAPVSWKFQAVVLIGSLVAGYLSGFAANYGTVGTLLGSLALTALTVFAVGKYWARLSAGSAPGSVLFTCRRQTANSVLAIVLLALGYLAFFQLPFVVGDDLTWAQPGRPSLSPSREFGGKEYRLIRKLKAFSQQIPSVEMVGGMTGELIPVPGVNLLFLLFMAVWLIGGAIFSLNDSRVRTWRDWWRPRLVITGLILLPQLAVLADHTLHGMYGGHLFSRTHGVLGFPLREFSLPQNRDTLEARLGGWLKAHGYGKHAESTWTLQTVPQGQAMGGYSVYQLWKPSRFDRWRITVSGPERRAPFLTVTFLSSLDPVQTLTAINQGWVGRGSKEGEGWGGIVDSLEAALKGLPSVPEPKKAALIKGALAIAPFSAQAARQYQEQWARALGLPVISTNSIGMKLAVIPPGEFDMGSRAEDMELLPQISTNWFFREWVSERVESETPQHRVTLAKPLLMGVHEVMHNEFQAFVLATDYRTDAERDPQGGFGWSAGEWQQNPGFNWRSPGFPQGFDQPVGNVSWNDAVAFCDWLSVKEQQKYRLPTEAEWEFACRAGSSTWYSSGDRDQSLRLIANIADASLRELTPLVPWAETWKDGYPFTAPMGRFQPNPFGLHDMHGNVWEWCSDWYDRTYYRRSPSVDPQGPIAPPQSDANAHRVFRGGGWDNYPGFCRSADRYSSHSPTHRTSWAGFRVVRIP